jgi:hypothetical protein
MHAALPHAAMAAHMDGMGTSSRACAGGRGVAGGPRMLSPFHRLARVRQVAELVDAAIGLHEDWAVAAVELACVAAAVGRAQLLAARGERLARVRAAWRARRTLSDGGACSDAQGRCIRATSCIVSIFTWW